MAGINEDRDRQVVPIWRAFDATMSRGELAPIASAPAGRFSDAMVEGLLEDWNDSRTAWVASDLVSVALTLGRYEIAKDAARFVLERPGSTPAAIGVANAYLAERKPITEPELAECEPPVGIARHLHAEVRTVRGQLVAYPRNPILWMNLARLYTSLGLQRKAERAMRVALAMAPENRFVLRCSSRLLLHLGERGQAHRVLADATSVKSDPWVLAAEIATSAANGRSSRLIKIGRRAIETQRHAPFHLSELASALGTLESQAGNDKRARQLIGFSLQQPAENSVAQAAWLQRRVGGVVPGQFGQQVRSSEADAWRSWQGQKWNLALNEACRWQADQPFSSRPAIFGSFLASVVLQDYKVAMDFAEQGLLSNPDDFTLQNNLAFAAAMGGDVAKARRALARVDVAGLDDRMRVVFDATAGLIAYRSGLPDLGRSLYRSATAAGDRLGDVTATIARIHFALEEVRLGSADAEATVKEALSAAAKLTEPAYRPVVDQLKNFK
jgi:tetratricopeptide (TPR) repeat protein